eukprot:TRINITY_DN1261_c0_g1_i1.p1 TRINITY_DN1261_c0_g1~~TRINITY_DN1261_c0_g1_i1.p1  ORF type:complete len:390 (-),score=81.55 TRINITY_DN1261_c0_g1_i1:30-1199(-)
MRKVQRSLYRSLSSKTRNKSLYNYRHVLPTTVTSSIRHHSSTTTEVSTTSSLDPHIKFNTNDTTTTQMNLFTSINSALDIALSTHPTSILFGEDVSFGGVFRCSLDLLSKHGAHRVFNTPLSEQGIAGFAIGYAALSGISIAEIQFADYIFPAIDQIINEAAKYRYRSGNLFSVGGLTFRTPYGAVGHGGLYHSQSPETHFIHTPGLKVVIPSNPVEAKGLLLASIRDPNPVIFFEPKRLYRSSVAQVPVGDYEIELGKGKIEIEGSDVTVIGYGAQIEVLKLACKKAREEEGINCELVNLRTVAPWDEELVMKSVRKTGRVVVSHEAPRVLGFGSEIVARIVEKEFLRLEAPVERVTGYDTPFPMIYEKYYMPDVLKCFEAIKKVAKY